MSELYEDIVARAQGLIDFFPTVLVKVCACGTACLCAVDEGAFTFIEYGIAL